MENKYINVKSNLSTIIVKAEKAWTKNFSYVIIDNTTKKAAIIDPAWELNKYEKVINKYNCILKMVLITHGHEDHTNLVEQIVSKYNTVVYVSKDEVRYEKFHCLNISETSNFQSISLGNSQIICIHTPGHTRGSQCFLSGDFLFTGDTIFIEGVGICENVEMAKNMYRSVNFIKRNISPNTHIYPGHQYLEKPGKSLKEVIKRNIYFNFKTEDHFASFRLREDQDSHYAFI